MASWDDERNAQSAEVHIYAAKAAPGRKELELNQADNFARLIQDIALKHKIEEKIRAAR